MLRDRRFVLHQPSQQTLPHVAAVEPQLSRCRVCCKSFSRLLCLARVAFLVLSLRDAFESHFAWIRSFLAAQTAGASHGSVGCEVRRTQRDTRAISSRHILFGMSFGFEHIEAACPVQASLSLLEPYFHLCNFLMLTLKRRRACPPLNAKRGGTTTVLTPFGPYASRSPSRSTMSGDTKVGPKVLDNILAIVDKVKARTMPRRVRTPNCTHVDMDRIYGRDQQCFVCGREPSIGFLYECRQDCRSPSLHDLLTGQEDVIEIARPKSPLRSELETIGLSDSVIRTAEQGHYTTAQLEVLKAQKQDLKQIIEDTIQGSQINDAVARLAAFARAPSNNDGTMNSKAKDAVSASALYTHKYTDCDSQQHALSGLVTLAVPITATVYTSPSRLLLALTFRPSRKTMCNTYPPSPHTLCARLEHFRPP